MPLMIIIIPVKVAVEFFIVIDFTLSLILSIYHLIAPLRFVNIFFNGYMKDDIQTTVYGFAHSDSYRFDGFRKLIYHKISPFYRGII